MGILPRSFAVYVLLFAAMMAAQTSKNVTTDLTGLWGCEEPLGPLVRGDLVVDGHSGEWMARIGGYDVTFHANGDEVRFGLPGNAGEFRGSLSRDRKQIVGNWIQPPSVFPYSVSYATPVELAELEPSVWQGTIHPLEEKVSFYLKVERGADGKLRAFVRNPEANMARGQTFDITVDGTNVKITNQGGRIDGTYDPERDTLTLPVLDGSSPLLFTRRDRNTAVGFYPRTEAATDAYVYRPPVPEHDGWQVGTLKEVGLNVASIKELIERILSTPPSLENPVDLHSLLIARHGKLVLEEYFYGYDEGSPHDLRSAGKTYTSLLAGIAHDKGFKIAPETPVYSFFAKYRPIANEDPRKAKMTIRDLLTMTSGYYCSDNDPNAPGNEDRMQNQTAQPDWTKYTLDLPMASDPGGTNAVYCSVDINLAMAAVRQATGEWVPNFFYENVARPLQMRGYAMNLTPTKEAYGGGGLQIRPRDELKLGQLYLSGGVWNGHRIVSDQWVKDSLTVHSHFKPALPSDTDHGYGYAWHSRPHQYRGKVIRDYYAAGNGGQYIIVLPELDMVVVMNGGDYSQAKKYYPFESDLLQRYIIAAVEKP